MFRTQTLPSQRSDIMSVLLGPFRHPIKLFSGQSGEDAQFEETAALNWSTLKTA